MRSKIIPIFVLVLSLGAQSNAPLPPLSSNGRYAIVAELRQRADAMRLWVELYYGTGGDTPFQAGLIKAFDEAADLVETYDGRPRKDPIQERHEYELIVVNSLRVAAGLEPYETWPEE